MGLQHDGYVDLYKAGMCKAGQIKLHCTLSGDGRSPLRVKTVSVLYQGMDESEFYKYSVLLRGSTRNTYAIFIADFVIDDVGARDRTPLV